MSALRPIASALARRPEVRPAAILGLLAAAERLALWKFYAPIEYNDTRAYFRLADVLSTSNLSGYDGSRVPGYPAFVALLGRDLSAVWAVQLFFGWGLTMLLFLLTWWTTGRATLALLVGGLYSLIPGLFLFESNLLTETLTSFLVVAAVVLVVWLDRGVPSSRRGLVLVTAGTAAAAAGLVRALFFVFPFWLLPFVLTSGSKGWRARVGDGALFLAPGLILLGGWLGFMRVHY
ncbi:MAG: hypothetical protein ACRDG5_05460, partial [Anaerolineales bacterium]